MENDLILRRVHELELEVAKLKAAVATSGRRRVQVVVKKSVGFVLTYWTLLSFVVAIGVAFYIKHAFNVDYFESYRTLAASRKMAEFHNRLGDDLLRRQEWAAAEESFTRAIAANANDPDAGYGLVKSRIFKPLPGEKYSWPPAQDATIAFLREQRPEDPDLDMLRAQRHWDQNQKAEARAAAHAALEKRPDFAWACSMLCHIEMSEGNIAEARPWAEKAVAAGPQDAVALSNLAFICMIMGDLEEAVEKARRSYLADAGGLTHLVLSDAFRLHGDYASALSYSRNVSQLVTDPALRESRVFRGEWFYNHLPEKKGDNTSWKSGTKVDGLSYKEALCQFAYALDLAFTGDTAAAEKPWARALELAPYESAHAYFLNKIKATLGWAPVPPTEELKSWLAQKAAALLPGE